MNKLPPIAPLVLAELLKLVKQRNPILHNKEIIQILDQKGYQSPTGKPFRSNEISSFAVRAGVRRRAMHKRLINKEPDWAECLVRIQMAIDIDYADKYKVSLIKIIIADF